MSERLKPTVNQLLFVSDESLEAIKSWPLELRAIFDPSADRKLTERIEREKGEAVRPSGLENGEIPF